MAETFSFTDDERPNARGHRRLDTMVTVVDGARLMDELQSIEELRIAASALMRPMTVTSRS